MWVTGVTVIALLIVSLKVLKKGLAFGYQNWLGFKGIVPGFPCSWFNLTIAEDHCLGKHPTLKLGEGPVLSVLKDWYWQVI